MPVFVRWEHPKPLCIYGNPWKTLWLGKLYQCWVKTTDSWLSGGDTWSDPHSWSAEVGELEAWGDLLRTLIPGILTQVSVLHHVLSMWYTSQVCKHTDFLTGLLYVRPDMKQVPKLGSLPASLGTTLWNILDSVSPSWCQWADVRLSTLQRPGSLDSSTAANRSNRPLPRQMKSNKAAKSTTYPSSPAESALRAIPKTHQNSYWEFLRGTESYSPSFQISLLEDVQVSLKFHA